MHGGAHSKFPCGLNASEARDIARATDLCELKQLEQGDLPDSAENGTKVYEKVAVVGIHR